MLIIMSTAVLCCCVQYVVKLLHVCLCTAFCHSDISHSHLPHNVLYPIYSTAQVFVTFGKIYVLNISTVHALHNISWS